MAKEKTIKKEASNVNTKGAYALDMRLHLVEKDVERLYKNVIEYNILKRS